MILYRGSSTVVERDFGVGVTGVTVTAKDFNGLTIPTTNPVQVGSAWRTTLTIPDGAPICTPDSGYYKLIWSHGSNTVEQDFQIVAYDEGVQRPSPAAFGIAGISLTDELYLPIDATNITCEILKPVDGSVALGSGAGTVSTNTVSTATYDSPGAIRATVEFTAPQIMVGEYVAHWRYEVNSKALHEYRQAFVISVKSSGMLASFRMFLDQSQVMRWLGHLQFADAELIDSLYRGADRINGHPPQVTTYSPDTMPQSLVYALRVAALHDMLNRLYLAEGYNTFDFQGGSIQVNTDRTQYLSTKMEELNSWLESNLTNVKAATVASRSIGVLHISVSQGGMNNNYRAHGTLHNPSAFQLARAYGFGAFL